MLFLIACDVSESREMRDWDWNTNKVAHKNILLTSKPHKEEKQKLSASAEVYSGRGISRVYFVFIIFYIKLYIPSNKCIMHTDNK